MHYGLRSVRHSRWIKYALPSAICLVLPTSLVAQQLNVPANFTGIVREKAPAVVGITTRQRVEEQSSLDDVPFPEFFRRYFGEGTGPGRSAPSSRSRQSLGSGFVISSDGFIVTNNHVVEDADDIQVVFGESKNVPARLIGRDPATDIAVLKVDPQPNMATVLWGNSDAAEPGAWAIAIGSPFGLGGTVTVGVVSARSRDIRSGPYDDYLQTDASINRGNSGGPLLDGKGDVIGVNTAIFSPSGGNIGIGFAVPSNTARQIAEQLIRSGKVERGYAGISLQELTPALAQALGRTDEKGALVASVEAGGPAEQAGLRPGDVVTQFNGKPVESGRYLSRAVAAIKPGTRASISVLRDGKPQELTIAVGERQDGGARKAVAANSGKRMGVVLAPLPESARDGGSGVLIQQVEPDSPAASSGLRAQDIVVSANNKLVKNSSDVATAWEDAQKQKKPMLLLVRRDGQSLFVAIPS